MKAFLTAAVVVTTAAPVAWMQTPSSEKHPFGPDDWTSLRRAAAIAISPDGSTILYRVAYGGAAGRDHLEWKLIDPDGLNVRKLDLPDHFTPFGFTRDGAGLYGAYQMNRLDQLAVFTLKNIKASDTPSIMVLLPSGMHEALISPDGSRFAILASQKPPDPLSGVRTVVEPRVASLYVVNADGTGGAWWCPGLSSIADGAVAPAGGTRLPVTWSTDGKSLAVLSQTPKIGFHAVRSSIDVCTASGAHHLIDIPNAVSGIAWADGGTAIAFVSTTTDVLTPDHVWTVPASGGKPEDRTPDLRGTAVTLANDARGNIWVAVQRSVHNEVDSFRDGTLATAYRWPDGVVSGPVSSQIAGGSDRLAFTVGDPQHASNIAVVRNGAVQKITSESDDLLGRVDLGPVRVVSWTSKEGIKLEGIATFPAGYHPGERYPFLLLPHGGPESHDALGLDWASRTVAGLGYVVIQPQYRGSTGYGTDFLQAIYQHFGDRAFRDVDSATDYAIAQGWADPNRLAIFGWSAGGFMTSWTITQTPRYRAAIEGAGITEWSSFIWTSDVQQIDYDATWPEQDIARYQRFSAVMQADRVTTPLLVLHGEADRRVPTYQGQEFFEALSARGKTTRMVTYPGSGHFPELWEQRRDIVRELAAWLAKYNSAPVTGSTTPR